MLQYQGPATARYSKSRSADQLPYRADLTLKQSLQTVSVIAVATRQAREVQLRHQGRSATALEMSPDTQHGSPKAAYAFSADDSPTEQITCLVLFIYPVQGQTYWDP